MDKVVDFCQGDVVKISANTLQDMKQIAKSNTEKKRYRICLHDTPENNQHEMLICVTKDDYSRPHKHIGMSETHIIIEGCERIVLFDENGVVRESFLLDRESGMLCYRVNSDVYHMSIPITDTVIEMETKRGPFHPESNIWASWAPDGADISLNRKYVEHIMEDIYHADKTV